MLSALVVGSTDVTGIQVVTEILKSGNFDKVTAIAEKEIDYQGPNKDHLSQHIVEVDKLEEHKELFKEYTHIFSCFENNGQTNNETQNVENLDQNYIIKASKILKEENSNSKLHYIYLSSSNNEKVEEELKLMKFSRLSIFKPVHIIQKSSDVMISNESIKTPTVDEISDIPITVLVKALVNITQMPVQESYNDDDNVIEYISNKDIYLIAKKSENDGNDNNEIKNLENDNNNNNIEIKILENDGNNNDIEIKNSENDGNNNNIEIKILENDGNNNNNIEIKNSENDGNNNNIEIKNSENDGNNNNKKIKESESDGNNNNIEIKNSENDGNNNNKEVKKSVNDGNNDNKEIKKSVNDGNNNNKEVKKSENGGNNNNKEIKKSENCIIEFDTDLASTSSLSLTCCSKDYRSSKHLIKEEKYCSMKSNGTESPIKPRIRYYTADNIRCLLMFLVVFGHLIESFEGPYRRGIYVFIYTFHMPFFIFLSGWFARFNPKKILRHLVFTYIVFQCIYIGTDMAVHYTKDLSFSISTPYWTLWYLFSLICYYILLPFFTTNNKRDVIIIIGCTCVITILSYVIENFDRYLSLSRSISFFPYFLAGYYFSQVFHPGCLVNMSKDKKIKWTAIFIPIFIAVETVLIIMDVPDNSIYRVSPEKNWKYVLLVPVLMAICNITFIPLSLFWTPNKKIPLITLLGQNTLPIYIFHVGVILVVRVTKLFHFAEPINILLSFAIAVPTMLLLGNHYFANVFKKVF